MSGEANGVLVECPICYGCGMLTNGALDPQDHEDGECHACSGGGSVTEAHRDELLDGMTDEALAALDAHDEQRHEQLQRALADDERWIESERLHELTQRDREWWS
jgi:hypothetical protein